MVQFTVDHIVPLAHGGTDDRENLALACFHCNRRKSSKTEIFDSISHRSVPIFDPRTMDWNEHFGWSEDSLKVVARSDIGRGHHRAFATQSRKGLANSAGRQACQQTPACRRFRSIDDVLIVLQQWSAVIGQWSVRSAKKPSPDDRCGHLREVTIAPPRDRVKKYDQSIRNSEWERSIKKT